MATDHSEQAQDGPWVTAQGARNMMSSRDAAMSAPGSTPVTPAPGLADQEDPSVDAKDFTASNREHGEGEAAAGSWTTVGARRSGLSRLCCPLCGVWSVPFRAAPDYGNGEPDAVTGECEQCESDVTVRPTQTAVRIAQARLAAMDAAGRS